MNTVLQVFGVLGLSPTINLFIAPTIQNFQRGLEDLYIHMTNLALRPVKMGQGAKLSGKF